MARTYMVTEYTNEDIEKLEHMSISDVVEKLEQIKRGWLPTNWTFADADPDRIISEDVYEATALHHAINIAIEQVKNIWCEKREDDESSAPMYSGEIDGMLSFQSGREYRLVRITKWTDRTVRAREESHKCFYFENHLHNDVLKMVDNEVWCEALFQYKDGTSFTALPVRLK